jgi:DNA-binding transcriptional LysR family regulator
MKSRMLTSQDMLTFIRVVEGGSFAAAADALGLTPSAVSKVISRVEDRLGVRLLTRTTRKLALTNEGTLYLTHARDITAAIEAAEEEVSESAARPSGRLRINTGTAFARHQLAPVLSRFLARYPDITVDLGVTDRQVMWRSAPGRSMTTVWSCASWAWRAAGSAQARPISRGMVPLKHPQISCRMTVLR